MLEKILGILFFLRKPRLFRKGPWLFFLRITVDGIHKELSLERIWERSRWGSKTGRASGRKEEARALNQYLELILAKVHESRSKLIEKNQPIIAMSIKDMVSGTAERKRMFGFVFDAHNTELENLVSVGEYSPATSQRFETAGKLFFDFIYFKYKVKVPYVK